MPEEVREWTNAREARNFLGVDQTRLESLVSEHVIRGSFDGEGHVVAVAAIDLPDGIKHLYPQPS